MSDARELLVGGLTAGAFLLCAAFLSQVALIVVPFLRRKPASPGDAADYEWHFVIPCLDEESVVEGTVRYLLDTFPAGRVWCVDDGSHDATAAILRHLARSTDRLHVVTRHAPRARTGKGPALNAAWQAITSSVGPDVDRRRVLVGVLDADSRLDPGGPAMVAGSSYFGDNGVGAVQIQVRVVDRIDQHTGGEPPQPRKRLVLMQDVEFTTVIAALQTFRKYTGSVGMGGNGQFTRLSVLDGVAAEHGSPWHGSLLEDFELGVHVLLGGDRTEYCHDTFVVQEGLSSIRRLVRQRSRWCQGSMQCIRYLWPVLKSPAVRTPAAAEIAHFLFLPWLQIIGASIYAACVGLLVWFAATAPGGPIAWFEAGAWGFLPLFVLFGIGPLVLWGPLYRRMTDRSLSRRRAFLIGVLHWPYTYVHHAAVWAALFRFLGARRNWQKTARAAATPDWTRTLSAPERARPSFELVDALVANGGRATLAWDTSSRSGRSVPGHTNARQGTDPATATWRITHAAASRPTAGGFTGRVRPDARSGAHHRGGGTGGSRHVTSERHGRPADVGRRVAGRLRPADGLERRHGRGHVR
ncbi:MAG: glycosyltransferase [Acidimicrobiales bacterium]